jgi:hypothetical protein
MSPQCGSSSELGTTANLRFQRILELPIYRKVWWNTRLASGLLPALRYFHPDLSAVTYPAGTEPTVTTEGEPPAVIPPVVPQPATDEMIIQRWADKVLDELISTIEVYEDAKRVRTPLTLT